MERMLADESLGIIVLSQAVSRSSPVARSAQPRARRLAPTHALARCMPMALAVAGGRPCAPSLDQAYGHAPHGVDAPGQGQLVSSSAAARCRPSADSVSPPPNLCGTLRLPTSCSLPHRTLAGTSPCRTPSWLACHSSLAVRSTEHELGAHPFCVQRLSRPAIECLLWWHTKGYPPERALRGHRPVKRRTQDCRENPAAHAQSEAPLPPIRSPPL